MLKITQINMKTKELKKILEKKSLDAAIFTSIGMEPNPNVVYYSQYTGVGALIIPKKQNPFLVVPEMEFERAKKSQIKLVYPMNKKKFFESVQQITKKKKIKTKSIGMDATNISLNTYKNLRKNFKKTKDLSLDCLKLRETKTNKEVKIIKKAFNFTNEIFNKTISNFKDFKTESEVAAFLEYESKKLGLGISFPPIVASGKNASMPHYEPRNIRLNKGLCVIDFGIKYKNYCTDMTRTIGIKKITKEEKNNYNFLLNIQNNLINDIKLNDKCSKIYENCIEQLKDKAKYFPHGLGHGVGVEIHELPNLTLNSKDRIKKNMVFTIEPGIYIPNIFGIRIEDAILMKNKPIILTKVAKDLLIV